MSPPVSLTPWGRFGVQMWWHLGGGDVALSSEIIFLPQFHASRSPDLTIWHCTLVKADINLESEVAFKPHQPKKHPCSGYLRIDFQYFCVLLQFYIPSVLDEKFWLSIFLLIYCLFPPKIRVTRIFASASSLSLPKITEDCPPRISGTTQCF